MYITQGSHPAAAPRQSPVAAAAQQLSHPVCRKPPQPQPPQPLPFPPPAPNQSLRNPSLSSPRRRCHSPKLAPSQPLPPPSPCLRCHLPLPYPRRANPPPARSPRPIVGEG
ncbi:hypothetical protein Salat_0651300 [Sesamum alatum]|uniref:Uncharacterized protein n=1 Tax=Sesamum alatum TaxID=300844 RepID=A0AAE2CUS5_9LAMI|nr:hypothetical protein Salat_0651300 [Sesamum alatum]